LLRRIQFIISWSLQGSCKWSYFNSWYQKGEAHEEAKKKIDEALEKARKKKDSGKVGGSGTGKKTGGAVHRKKKRPSTEDEHEKGKARKKRDKPGGEKGDKRLDGGQDENDEDASITVMDWGDAAFSRRLRLCQED
jgi:hypothetical protein